MKYEVIFLDFYGTLVAEDNEIITAIGQQFTASTEVNKAFGRRWYQIFAESCRQSHGAHFRTQRAIELASLSTAMQEFSFQGDPQTVSEALFVYWERPSAFAESHPFLSRCPLPICIVSNVDNQDILSAARHHGWQFPALITSESARAYKPRAEIFQAALNLMQTKPSAALHVGDSLLADVRGAQAVGIDMAWINRTNRRLPDTYAAPTFILPDLTALLNLLNDKGSGTELLPHEG